MKIDTFRQKSIKNGVNEQKVIQLHSFGLFFIAYNLAINEQSPMHISIQTYF